MTRLITSKNTTLRMKYQIKTLRESKSNLKNTCVTCLHSFLLSLTENRKHKFYNVFKKSLILRRQSLKKSNKLQKIIKNLLRTTRLRKNSSLSHILFKKVYGRLRRFKKYARLWTGLKTNLKVWNNWKTQSKLISTQFRSTAKFIYWNLKSKLLISQKKKKVCSRRQMNWSSWKIHF